ncbi:MAG: DUF1846 domain-containing protein [Clostridia bacterium]
MNIGFDNDKYIKMQSEKILERIKKYDKLYLEFGGKIFDDLHAERVLPGYDASNKINILKKLSSDMEIFLVVSAIDIEKNKIRADFGITYDMEVLRLMDNLREQGLTVSTVVITLFEGQQAAKTFANKLEQRGEKVYFHKFTKGYPSDINSIVSDEGYGANPFIPSTKKLIVVAAPGPASGKLATCLSQIYHEHKVGVKAGYSKFETFPVWNLSLEHPVNYAYEAATAELKDENVLDPFHFAKYGKVAINYNRDVELFPVVKKILSKILKSEEEYSSPTDMGVNMVGYAISNDELCKEAARQEIVRRYYRIKVNFKKGLVARDTVDRIEFIMEKAELSTNIRAVVAKANDLARETGNPCVALELPNGKIITGRTKELLGSCAACALNAAKEIAGISDDTLLISPEILYPILSLKKETFGIKMGVLSLKDIMFALSICARTDKNASKALEAIKELKNCEAHSSNILNPSDEDTMRKLKINMTSEPVFLSKNLFEI